MSNYSHTIFNIPYCHTDIKSIISIFLMTTVAFASPHTITQQAKRKQIRSSQRSLQRCPRCCWNKNFFSHFTWHGSPMCRVFMRIIWRLDYILCLSVILAMKWVRIRKFDILHCQSYVGFSFFYMVRLGLDENRRERCWMPLLLIRVVFQWRNWRIKKKARCNLSIGFSQ